MELFEFFKTNGIIVELCASHDDSWFFMYRNKDFGGLRFRYTFGQPGVPLVYLRDLRPTSLHRYFVRLVNTLKGTVLFFDGATEPSDFFKAPDDLYVSDKLELDVRLNLEIDSDEVIPYGGYSE